jgi:chemotaxis response regulator CheB
MRLLIRKFVESNGYSVCGEAEDGLQAIEQAKAWLPPSG